MSDTYTVASLSILSGISEHRIRTMIDAYLHPDNKLGDGAINHLISTLIQITGLPKVSIEKTISTYQSEKESREGGRGSVGNPINPINSISCNEQNISHVEKPDKEPTEYEKDLTRLEKFKDKIREYKHTDPKFNYMHYTYKCIKIIEKYQDKKFVAIVRVHNLCAYPIMFFSEDDLVINHDITKLIRVEELIGMPKKTNHRSFVFCNEAFTEYSSQYTDGKFVNHHKNLTIFTEDTFSISKIFEN